MVSVTNEPLPWSGGSLYVAESVTVTGLWFVQSPKVYGLPPAVAVAEVAEPRCITLNEVEPPLPLADETRM